MEDCAPSFFYGNRVLMTHCLCFKFCIFSRFILKKFVSQVEGAQHLLQSCFHVAQNDLPHTTKKMHPSFENLVITVTPSLHAFFMDTQHDISLRSILEDDFIPSTSKVRIHSCSSKGAKLSLVAKPSICSFPITHFTFTSTLCFCFGLIQPLASSLLTYKCGHKLHASNTHLAHCPFRDQQIITHDTTPSKRVDMMYGESSVTPLHQKFHYKSIST
jgi:hypothetical protein